MRKTQLSVDRKRSGILSSKHVTGFKYTVSQSEVNVTHLQTMYMIALDSVKLILVVSSWMTSSSYM